jgi:hypothetical protein
MYAETLTPAGAARPEFALSLGLGRYFPNPTGALFNSLGNAIGNVAQRIGNFVMGSGWNTNEELAGKAVASAAGNMGQLVAQLAANLGSDKAALAQIRQMQAQGLLTEFDDERNAAYQQLAEQEAMNNSGLRSVGAFTNHVQLATDLVKVQIEILKKYGDQIDPDKTDDKFYYLKDGKGKILRDVPYYSQRDNETDDYLGQVKVFNKKTGKYEMQDVIVNWKNMCNLTTAAMLLANKGVVSADEAQLEDRLWENMKNNPKYKDMQKPSDDVALAMRMAINPNFAFKAKFTTAEDNDDDLTDFIKQKIDAGIPVGVSGDFPRAGKKPAAYIITIIGYNDKGWVVNDPYGAYKNSKIKWQSSGTQGVAELYKYGKYNLTGKRAYWLEAK